MKKILIIAPVNLVRKVGVDKKILAQIKAIKNNGIQCNYIAEKNNKNIIVDQNEYTEISKVEKNNFMNNYNIYSGLLKKKI